LDINEDVSLVPRLNTLDIYAVDSVKPFYRIARKQFTIDIVRGKGVVTDKLSEKFGRHSIDPRNTICSQCDSLMWIKERTSGSSIKNPKFSLCCSNGKVKLPVYEIPDNYREFLLKSMNTKFRDQMRLYNSALAFTLTKITLDETLMNKSKGKSF
jgi:hypothetical protein